MRGHLVQVTVNHFVQLYQKSIRVKSRLAVVGADTLFLEPVQELLPVNSRVKLWWIACPFIWFWDERVK